MPESTIHEHVAGYELGPGTACGAIAFATGCSMDEGQMLDSLAGMLWPQAERTLNWRVRGADTLTWGDQIAWMKIREILDLLSLSCAGPLGRVFASAMQHGRLLAAVVERRRLETCPSFQDYMRQVEAWAKAYDKEAVERSPVELESLYDDAYFEAMDLQEKLP